MSQLPQPGFPAPGPSVPTTGPAATTPPSDLVHEALNQVRSELRKTFSTKLWWALLIPAALVSLLVNVLTTQGGALAFTSALGMALALGSTCSVFPVLYGVVCAAGETRHRTITISYLAQPRRPVVVGAKALVAAAIGAVYAVVAALAGVVGVLLGDGFPQARPQALFEVCAVAVVVFALWAMIGVGVATLLNNQLAAIVAVLLYLLLVENILEVVTDLFGVSGLKDYLPGKAADGALRDLASSDSLGGIFGGGALPWWLALLVFAGYAVATLVAGALAAARRDIT